jgi:hypothetical protein
MVEVDSKHATIDIAYALTAISYIIILTRLALRRFKHESFTVDDWLMGFSMILYFFNTAAYPISVCESCPRGVEKPFQG